MSLLYTGPSKNGVDVKISGKSGASASFSNINLVSGVTLLSIDATASGKTDLGSKTTITIDGKKEELHTSCSVAFESGKPAPLDKPKGAPSTNWFVDSFTQK